MDQLFLQIFNMSITASYVIIFVIVARFFLKKAPKIFSYTLWSVVFFRLVWPFSFESIFSLLPTKTQVVPQNIAYSPSPQIDSGVTFIDRMVNNSLPAPAPEFVSSVNPMQIWVTMGVSLWLLGLVVLLTYSILTALRLSHNLKVATPIYDNIYEVNTLKTPFVLGFIKPKIYLPASLSETERAYIIKHEQTHINRFDHIIKPAAFLVLCVHWFNPLVWVAFFLMSEDMELSCDESVIKQLGNDIKKDYSTLLLSFSTGRRIIGGSPLAFGENNTKGRIMNILNYRKPKFWVVIVAFLVVAAIGIGLISNPQQQITVEDYANQFINAEIDSYENAEWTQFEIVDSKITKLEKIASFNHLLSYPIEMWSLEYRLKPDDINKVMFAGGMNEVDGWITEDTSMGKPMLVISYEGRKAQYVGNMWSGEADLTTIAGKETALRVFLEGKGLLPQETYSGNHIVVQFPLSTGETSQLFLSQPVVQGDLGIWCVERWRDGNGNVYYDIPQTNGIISEYYKELQQQSDEGMNQSLLDPLQVALDYINNDLGQRVSMDELSIQYSATADDFAKTPESQYIGFISNFNKDSSSFSLDTFEWLTFDDADRLKELNIDPDMDMPNGYYIHNPDSYPMWFQVTEETEYTVVNWGGYTGENEFYRTVNKEEFVDYLETYINNASPPIRVITKDGYVVSITEIYVP